MEAGPRSLEERVAALEGDLVITTGEEGATLEIVVGQAAGARTER